MDDKEKKRLHHVLLTEISEHLSPDMGDDYKKFLLLLRGYNIPPAHIASSAKDIHRAFNALESKGYLSVGKYDVLIQIMEHIDLQIVELIKEYQLKINSTTGLEGLEGRSGSIGMQKRKLSNGKQGSSTKRKKLMKTVKERRSQINSRKTSPLEGIFGEPEVHVYRKNLNDTSKTLIHDVISKCSKSVGCIVSPEMTGTGFRVGDKYLMTCWHVVEPIILDVKIENEKEVKIYNNDRMMRAEVYVHFEYKDEKAVKPEMQFKFVGKIPYHDKNLDVAILELKQEEGKSLPTPVTKFDYPIPNDELYFIGHPDGSIMKTDDRVKIFERNADTRKKIIDMNEWCKDKFKVEGYKSLYDENKVIFDCRFKHGASGCPGMIVADKSNDPVVIVMLQGGVPNMSQPALVMHADEFPDNYHKEFGIGMKTIYLNMKKAPELNSLLREIFKDKRFVSY